MQCRICNTNFKFISGNKTSYKGLQYCSEKCMSQVTSKIPSRLPNPSQNKVDTKCTICNKSPSTFIINNKYYCSDQCCNVYRESEREKNPSPSSNFRGPYDFGGSLG